MTPFSSSEQKRAVFSLVDGDYEDVRIDHNQDKKMDYWRVKEGNLVVETYFSSSNTLYHVRRFQKNHVEEKIFFAKDRTLYLLRSQRRAQLVYNYTNEKPLCSDSVKTAWTELQKNLDAIGGNLTASTDKFIGDQCLTTLEDFNPKISTRLPNATNDIFSPRNNTLLNCLESPQVKSTFVQRFGELGGPLEHEKAIVGFKNSIIQFVELGSNPKAKPRMTCKKVKDSPKNPMSVVESGDQIQFQFTDTEISVLDIKGMLFHESLHMSSVQDEDLAKAVTDQCIYGKATKLEAAKQEASSKSFGSTTSLLDTINGQEAEARATSQAIPKSVAEAPLPPPANAAPVEMNRMAEAVGTGTVAQVSRAQTSGVIRIAESMLSSTPAQAASTPSTSLASESSRESRAPASSAKVPAIKIPSSKALKADTLARGEYIKEEIDLTKGARAPSAEAPMARTPNKTDAVQKATGVPTSSELASSSAAVASESSPAPALNSRTPSSVSSNGKVKTKTPKTSPSRSVSSIPSRDEVVSFFSNTSYQQARGKLKDRNFIQTLKENRITVFDLGGNAYGAPKGEVIFVDQGDRFVRQK